MVEVTFVRSVAVVEAVVEADDECRVDDVQFGRDGDVDRTICCQTRSTMSIEMREHTLMENYVAFLK